RPRPFRGSRDRRFKLALLVGTALGGAALAAPPALADDECGAPVAGQVICTATGNPYAQGITYESITALDVELRAGAQVVTQDDNTRGVTLYTGALGRLVSAGTVSTSGEYAHGINVNSFGDAIVVATGAVSVTGDRAYGVSEFDAGAADVVVRDVRSEGLDAHGV